MTQNSRFWDGVLIGDATEAPYDAPNEFAAVLRSLNGANANSHRSGVCRDELNELACSTPGGLVVTVATGRAFVHGTWYENDANVSFNIDATPPTQNRVDLVVLQKTWATQQVRLAIHKGIDAVIAPTPTPTQTDLTVWEFPLYEVWVIPAGTVTLTDVRQYVPYLSSQTLDRIADTTLLVADDLVTFDITSQPYRMYMAVINAQIDNALHVGETFGMYFTPTGLTEYDWAVLQTYGTPPLSHSAPGLFNTWYIECGNIGESTPYTTRSCMNIIFMTNLLESLDKATFSIRPSLSSNLTVEIGSGTYRYALPVTQVNFCTLTAGHNFKAGSRFTLYGIT